MSLRCQLLSFVKLDNKNVIAGNEVYVSNNKSNKGEQTMIISFSTIPSTNYAQTPQNGLRPENELHFPKEPQSVEDFLNSIKEADKISINDIKQQIEEQIKQQREEQLELEKKTLMEEMKRIMEIINNNVEKTIKTFA